MMRSHRARERGIMRHQHERHAALAMLGEQQIDDLVSGCLVEISGRLVREQDRGVGRERTRDGNPLLFAARQLRRIMMQSLTKADRLQFARGAFAGIASRRPAPAGPPHFQARSLSG